MISPIPGIGERGIYNVLLPKKCYNIKDMAQRNIPLVPGEYFHIYNRGNSKQKIFLDNKDKDRFVKLLYLSNSTKNINFRDDIIDAKLDVWHFEKGKSLVSIGAWVLMPNHFHIYLISPIPGIGEKEDRRSEERRVGKECR